MSTTSKMAKFFDLFDSYEKNYNSKSKFHCVQILQYTIFIHFLLHTKQQLEPKNSKQKGNLEKTNELIELLSKVIHILIVNIGVPGIILPKAIFSFYKYFTTDAQNDAFELAAVSRYVAIVIATY